MERRVSEGVLPVYGAFVVRPFASQDLFQDVHFFLGHHGVENAPMDDPSPREAPVMAVGCFSVL